MKIATPSATETNRTIDILETKTTGPSRRFRLGPRL
jgi:hypothetical protein